MFLNFRAILTLFDQRLFKKIGFNRRATKHHENTRGQGNQILRRAQQQNTHYQSAFYETDLNVN